MTLWGRVCMDTPKDQRTPEEKEAAAERSRAEARKADAEAGKAIEETRTARLQGDLEELLLQREQLKQKAVLEAETTRLASDDQNRTYRFLTGVAAGSVKDAIDTLVRWSRIDPECDITFIIDSPGGSIIDGFHLFDTILDIRRRGHKVTTVAQGMAASMGGVLLQAGDHRVMSEQASLLIHEAAFSAMGSYGQVEDTMEFVKMLQGRILDIFAQRSKLSKRAIAAKWKRKNWWMLADEALKHGFCDEVRGLNIDS